MSVKAQLFTSKKKKIIQVPQCKEQCLLVRPLVCGIHTSGKVTARLQLNLRRTLLFPRGRDLFNFNFKPLLKPRESQRFPSFATMLRCKVKEESEQCETNQRETAQLK